MTYLSTTGATRRREETDETSGLEDTEDLPLTPEEDMPVIPDEERVFDVPS